jgi:hypothetical protein
MACERAGIDVSEIDAIIFATLSPDYTFPGSGASSATSSACPASPRSTSATSAAASSTV